MKKTSSTKTRYQVCLSPTKPLPLPEAFSHLPSQPGVYWWLDSESKILYVGKAKNLKNRLTSYKNTGQLAPKIREMVASARFINYQILSSELEALLVEAELIQNYQPPYNTLLKDDKSPLYIVITKEEFPRVLRLRKRDLTKKKTKGQIFGPYQSSYKVEEVLKIIRPVFPWCNAPRRLVRGKMKRCFENHLHLCPGVCSGTISTTDYQKIINNLALFLRGKTSVVTDDLKKQLAQLSQAQEYEQAAIIRDQLQLIKEITSDTYKLRTDLYLPNLNVERADNALMILKKILTNYLQLPREYQLERIEGYDVSNTSGKLAVVSQVVFTRGMPDNDQYRLFNIKLLDTPNDFAMLAQALSRRATHDDWQRPQLVLIDGGKGQVRAVLEALQLTPWHHQPLIGLAKDPDRLVIPEKIVPPKTGSRLQISWQVLKLDSDNLGLQLLQQVRDEAHRFGKHHHLRRRQQTMIK